MEAAIRDGLTLEQGEAHPLPWYVIWPWRWSRWWWRRWFWKHFVSGILHFAMPTRLLKSDCLPGSPHTIWDVSRKDSDKDWYVQLSMICLSNQNSVRYALLVSNLKQINGREKFPEESLKTKLQESLGRVIYKMKRIRMRVGNKNLVRWMIWNWRKNN